MRVRSAVGSHASRKSYISVLTSTLRIPEPGPTVTYRTVFLCQVHIRILSLASWNLVIQCYNISLMKLSDRWQFYIYIYVSNCIFQRSRVCCSYHCATGDFRFGTCEEAANFALIPVDQLSAEFAKQRNSLTEHVSFMIRESIKPLQTSCAPLTYNMLDNPPPQFCLFFFPPCFRLYIGCLYLWWAIYYHSVSSVRVWSWACVQ